MKGRAHNLRDPRRARGLLALWPMKDGASRRAMLRRTQELRLPTWADSRPIELSPGLERRPENGARRDAGLEKPQGGHCADPSAPQDGLMIAQA